MALCCCFSWNCCRVYGGELRPLQIELACVIDADILAALPTLECVCHVKETNKYKLMNDSEHEGKDV